MKKYTYALIALTTYLLSTSPVLSQGTGFTYQGRLSDGGNLANGIYDLRFTIYDSGSAGNLIAGPLTNSATGVSNGLFTVTLDFGNVFPGAARWLEIAVRTNGSGAFTELSTRQQLTPAPYAITAGTVVSGGLPSGVYGNAVSFTNTLNNFRGSFGGDGSGLSGVNAGSLGGYSASSFWNINGNTGAGNFLGSIDNQPVVLRANNVQAMELAYASNSVSGASPNVIGGSSANSAAAGVVGATIGGGGAAGIFSPNTVTADFGTVVGGSGCSASGRNAIAGGGISAASGQDSVALGGLSQAKADYSVAMGNSTASGTNSTAFGNSQATNSYATAMGAASVAGGYGSTAMGSSAATGGNSTAMGGSVASGIGSTAMGYAIAKGDYSVALGGSDFTPAEADAFWSFAAGAAALAAHAASFVWCDGSLPIYTTFSTTAADQFLIHANGGVGIGTNAPGAALHVVSAVAPYSGAPQALFTQLNSSDAARLRMNVNGYLGWEMDVSPGSTPQYQIWYVGAAGPRMTIDTSGNVYATSFNGTSDRNAKENLQSVDVSDVLDKVAALPITRWNFKTDTNTVHVGPMAQDFHAAFNVGTDDKHLASVDEDGVALAAIQGLNQKLNEKEAEIADLKTRLEKLEQLVTSTQRK